MSFSIVTDSASDIPKQLIQDYNIAIVPTTVIIGEEEYLDHEISISQLLRILKSGIYASTSQPSPELFEDKYKQALGDSQTKEVLAIHISSKLSGLFSTGYAVAQNINGSISLFDTRNVSIGAGYFVLLAAYLREHGYQLNRVLSILENTRSRVNIEVLIDDVSYLKKGGRVNLGQYTFLKILRLKPIITNKNGKLVRAGIARGKVQGLKKVCNRIKSYQNVGLHPMIFFGYADTPEDIESMKACFSDFDSLAPVDLQIGSTLLSHAGPGVAGVMIGPDFEKVKEEFPI